MKSMEKQEVTLLGNNYWGRFSAIQEKKELWAGSEYTEHLEDNYRWSGVGIIKHIETGEAHRFLLTTSYNPRREIGLVECLVEINGKLPNPRPKIVNQYYVYDLVLGQMYDDAKEGEGSEIIPKVSPMALSCEELLNRGLVTEESGQIRLHLQA